MDRRAAKQPCCHWVEMHLRRRARGAERPVRSAVSLALPCLQARKVPEKMEDLIEFFLDTGAWRLLGCFVALRLGPWLRAFAGVRDTAMVPTHSLDTEPASCDTWQAGSLAVPART